ncbi:SLC13 family permease [Anaerotruncus rubiinfantis]|uniref:SLC13 family permease n=1 Tax=Anaerotruncus rubiinfantis TaxID=1720200 RepID=UPI00189BBCA7|nr:SLC13 family permease [Anaerotruncus rubiinfantis]
MAIFLSFCAILLSILIGNRFKINVGILAGSFAVLIGVLVLQMPASAFFALLPGKIIFTVTMVTLFYGFLSENGTLQAAIGHVLYALKGRISCIPLALFLMSIVISGIGTGAPTATVILAPIAMAVAPCIGRHSLLLGVSVSYGVCIGGNFILSQGGIISSAIIDQSLAYAGQGRPIMLRAFFLSLLFFSLTYSVVYLLTRGRASSAKGSLPEPRPFTPAQARGLLLLCLVLGTVIAFSLLGQLLAEGYWKTVFTQFDLSFVMLLGVLAQSALSLGEFPTVCQKYVPVQMLVFFTGMTLLMGVAVEAGVVEWLSALVKSNVPALLLPAALAFIAGVMSCFSSSLSVVIPVLFPLVPALSSELSVSHLLLYSAIFIGSTCAGISPFSTGGFLLVSNCRVQHETHGLRNSLLVLAVVNILCAALFLLVLSLL